MNSYLNPLLQLLRFTPVFRNNALHHVAGNCTQDCCLLCEIGFFCDMLEKSHGKWCQATNLLLAYRSLPEGTRYLMKSNCSKLTFPRYSAALLHIVEETYPRNTLDIRISVANRFLLQQFCRDSRKADLYDSTLDQVRCQCRAVSLAYLACRHSSRTVSLLFAASTAIMRPSAMTPHMSLL